MLLANDLEQFTGTEKYYKHWLGFNYTDGIHYLVEKGNCYWLLDIIGSYQPKHKNKPFQIWELKVNEDKSAIIDMKEDSDKPILVKQKLDWTDFSLNEIKMYLIDGVLLLPSEY